MTRYLPGNRLALLQNGEEYFPRLFEACEKAKREIHIETYIFEYDSVGQAMVDLLIRAARRGVRVHLLMDGFGSKLFPKDVYKEMLRAGVRALFFRPETSLFRVRRGRLRRLHRKVAVVDGEVAFVGGINVIADMEEPGLTAPRFDFAVEIRGPLVDTVWSSAKDVWRRVAWTHFKRRWASRRRPRRQPAAQAGETTAAFVVRDNVRHRRDIERAYLRAISQAKREVIIANAYFLPGMNFRHVLIDAVRRGVKVTLLLQGRVEYFLVHHATRALYSTLLDAGVEIHEYHRSYLHAKVAVVDGEWATVGSSNIDPFSLLLSREANVLVHDAGFAAQLRARLLQAMEVGAHRVSKEDWQRQSLFARTLSWGCFGVLRFLMGVVGYTRETDRGRVLALREPSA